MLALPRLDLVVLATPNDLHEPQALAVLAAGKRVVVDKPMALTVAGADRMILAARHIRAGLTPFHNRRWDADFLTVRRVIAEGVLGPIHTFEARWNRYRPSVPDRWRECSAQGGGVLFDLGTHLVDQALSLFGMPDWLQADLYSQRPGTTVEDAFEVRMGSGRLRVVLGASSLVAEPGPRYRVVGDLGSLTMDGIDPQEEQLRAGTTPADTAFGLASSDQGIRLTIPGSAQPATVPMERGGWLEFYRLLRLCIETGSPPPVLPEDARRVLQVMEAARHSTHSGTRLSMGEV